MAKLMVRGHEVSGTVSSATGISCMDKDGNLSNVQAEFNDVRDGLNGVQDDIDNINKKNTAADGTVFRFGVNENGEYGYIVTDSEGADSVIPFKRNSKGMEYDLVHNFSEELWPTTSGTMNTAMFRGTFSGQTKLINVSEYSTIKVRGTIRDYTGFYPSGSISISTDGSTWINVYKYSSSNKNTYWDISYDISEMNAIYVKVNAQQANNCTCIYSSIALCT